MCLNKLQSSGTVVQWGKNALQPLGSNIKSHQPEIGPQLYLYWDGIKVFLNI